MGYKRAFDLHLALAGRQVERGAQIVVLAVHRGAALGQQPDLLRVALIGPPRHLRLSSCCDACRLALGGRTGLSGR
eukprot:904445-Prorocentrum_minimum.AAC.2